MEVGRLRIVLVRFAIDCDAKLPSGLLVNQFPDIADELGDVAGAVGLPARGIFRQTPRVFAIARLEGRDHRLLVVDEWSGAVQVKLNAIDAVVESFTEKREPVFARLGEG